MKKKVFIFLFSFVFVINLVFDDYKQVQAVWVAPAIPEGLALVVELLTSIGITCSVLSKYDNWQDMTNEESLQAYNEEQKYLQDMQTYMIDGSFGSTQNCSVITADGQVLTLEEALNTATTMSMDDYIEMRKKTNSPNPTKKPGIDWGSIFIDNAVGGLMDFLADFLIDKKCEEDGYAYPSTFYTGDSGYINRSTGDYHFFIESDSYELVQLVPTVVKHGIQFEYTGNVFSFVGNSFRPSDFRLCIVMDSSGILSYGGSYIKGCRFYVYCNLWENDTLKYSIFGVFSPHYFAFTEGDYKLPCYLSTNLPVFSSLEEAEPYLLWGSTANTLNLTPYSYISDICNNYKNKIVSLTNVTSYGITPTPTLSPTPKPTATPTPSPTPTPTPYPTWDKESGNGDNFTIYNFYTETTNNFSYIQSTINTISETVTNIYNFFQIDTQQITEEMDLNTDLPFKFAPLVSSMHKLKTSFPDDVYSEESGLLDVDYPKITVKCPEILSKYLTSDSKGMSVDDDGNKVIVLCDFADYAVYFARFRMFLKAVLWIGMIFLLMREFRVVLTVS